MQNRFDRKIPQLLLSSDIYGCRHDFQSFLAIELLIFVNHVAGCWINQIKWINDKKICGEKILVIVWEFNWHGLVCSVNKQAVFLLAHKGDQLAFGK